MHILRILATLILCIVSAFAADGEKYALLVGVSEYRPDSGLRTLKYAESDMAALARTLAESGFDPAHIFLMTQSALGNDSTRPRRENIERELDLLLNNKQKDDTVLVVFSGHGLQFRGDRESFFCPGDARKDPKSGKLDKTTLVNVSDVYARLEKCAAGNKLLISDCCRNDPLDEQTRGAIGETIQTGQLKLGEPDKPQSQTRPVPLPPPESVAALFSCAEGEFAYEEDKEFQGGVFTHYLIEGLKGQAALDGVVDLESLAAFLRRRVYDHVHRVFLAAQTPEIKLRGNKSFVLARIGAQKSVRVAIKTIIMGTLKKVAVHEGDLVKKGDVLFELDDADYQAALNQARATLQEALRDLQRAKELKAQNAISAAEVDAREAAFATARAADNLAKQNVSACSIKSPVAGRVERINTDEGSMVSPTSETPLAIIVTTP
ncbi:MAG TPA: caspase family protein [Planctomycetota bacterium]|nr:caspase family protein [Planctomycetota bacterium]